MRDLMAWGSAARDRGLIAAKLDARAAREGWPASMGTRGLRHPRAAERIEASDAQAASSATRSDPGEGSLVGITNGAPGPY